MSVVDQGLRPRLNNQTTQNTHRGTAGMRAQTSLVGLRLQQAFFIDKHCILHVFDVISRSFRSDLMPELSGVRNGLLGSVAHQGRDVQAVILGE